MPRSDRSGSIRVGFYGTGGFARRTRIPNILRTGAAQVIALCDINQDELSSTANRFGMGRTYTDAYEMLEAEQLDVLYSCVPPFAHGDVEITAAERGIHIFSEKPQALTMKVARDIDEAIRKAGVIGTVGFRERYRPIHEEARRFLANKEVIHARFTSSRALPPRSEQKEDRWQYQMDKSGGPALDWGVHAVDLVRYMTGLDITKAQAFYTERESYALPLSSSFNFQLSNGGTMSMIFVSSLRERAGGHHFAIFYEGGRLDLPDYRELKADGEVVFTRENFDPWFEQDQTFIGAVRAGDTSQLRNDYHDGLYTLAPVLAGWESSRRGGQLIDISTFVGT